MEFRLNKAAIASPLRYPGGKSRLARRIANSLPQFEEFREPFVGGGSVFLAAMARNPDAKFWINDLSLDVAVFWSQVSLDVSKVLDAVNLLQISFPEGPSLYRHLKDSKFEDPAMLAARFFLLSRITFSGTIDSGGFSQEAFEKRLTRSAVERLAALSSLANFDLSVTNLDYASSLDLPGHKVTIFLDPPYETSKNSLYGRWGDLHRNFDFDIFAAKVKRSPHPWVMTYGDNEQVRDTFLTSDGYTILPLQFAYGMTNQGGIGSRQGREVLVTNSDLIGWYQ